MNKTNKNLITRSIVIAGLGLVSFFSANAAQALSYDIINELATYRAKHFKEAQRIQQKYETVEFVEYAYFRGLFQNLLR